MKTGLIFHDYVGMPNRSAMLEHVCKLSGVRFLRISSESSVAGAEFVDVPKEWLPKTNSTKNHPIWWRGHLPHVIAASRMTDVDFAWCVEHDVWGTPETWMRLFNQTSEAADDGLTGILSHRSEHAAGWFKHPSTPENFDWLWHPCVMRLSARAVGWLLASAEETREVFTEVWAPSVIANSGGKIRRINQCGGEPLCHPCTLKFAPSVSPPNNHPRRLRHPIKTDDPPFSLQQLT